MNFASFGAEFWSFAVNFGVFCKNLHLLKVAQKAISLANGNSHDKSPSPCGGGWGWVSLNSLTKNSHICSNFRFDFE